MARKVADKTLYWILAALAVLILALLWLRPIRVEGFQQPRTVDLVIARFKEPLDWLQDYKEYPIRNLYIYNKSDQMIDCPKGKWKCHKETLPNVGVCDHTYLYHILKVYDDPDQADMTIFLPASVTAKEYKLSKVKTIIDHAIEGKQAMSGYRINGGRSIQDELGSFSLDEWKVSDTKNQDQSNDFHLVKADPRPFGEWYKKYFPNESTDKVSLTGMFTVSRDSIRSNPAELYTSLIATVSRDKYSEAAHFVERCWATLFKNISYEDLL